MLTNLCTKSERNKLFVHFCNILFQLMKHGPNTSHVAFIFLFSIFLCALRHHAQPSILNKSIWWKHISGGKMLHIIFMQIFEYSNENLSPIGWKPSLCSSPILLLLLLALPSPLWFSLTTWKRNPTEGWTHPSLHNGVQYRIDSIS